MTTTFARIETKMAVVDLLMEANTSIHRLYRLHNKYTDQYEAVQLTNMKAALKKWDARKGEWNHERENGATE